ncbi:hypothetical protein ACWGH4_04700 [Streptomyces sp. NPDC054847]
MSRAELMKRLEKLRKQDAAKKPQVTAKARISPRPKPTTAAKRTRSTVATPQPYYGVEMKSIGGRWVQMHPDSE